jgi:hypothetical protein
MSSGGDGSSGSRGPGSIRRALSKSSLFDCSAFPVSPNGCYFAIFEFAQGSSPRTAYEYEPVLSDADADAFRMAVVNTPTNMLSGWDSPPIVVRSASRDLHYVASFLQIQDVQARGFARAIVLVVANRYSQVIDCVAYRHGRDLNELSSKIREHSKKNFPIELAVYSRSLQNVIGRTTGDTNSLLTAKLTELTQMVESSNLTFPDIDAIPTDEHPIEFFTQINNALRPIDDLLQLESLKPAIESFMKTLPTDQIGSNFAMAAWHFLGPITSDVLRTFTAQHDLVYTFAPLIGTRKLQACLYALFSGRTVALLCTNQEAGLSFAERLSVISPFPGAYAVCQQPSSDFDYVKYPIVIGPRINSEFVSALNLDDNTFDGAPCPTDSFIMHKFFQQTEIWETWVYIAAANDARRMYGRFCAKVAELTGRARQTQERMLRALEWAGFARTDEPIMRCWMDALGRRGQGGRVLLL